MIKKYTDSPIPKTDEEIKHLINGGLIWQKIVQEIKPHVVSGTTGKEIEKKIIELFKKHNLETAFQNFNKFPGVICISINDCIVHGLANNQILKKGDKITLDIGFKYKNLFIDSAITYIIDPDTNDEYQKFIELSYQALWAGINSIKLNGFVGDITNAIESFYHDHLKGKYSILDSFSGHGIGKGLHEPPIIPNSGLKTGEGAKLIVNSVICIEPMFLEQKNGRFKIGLNGYDVVAEVPGAKSSHWEHMVAITKDGIKVLTATEEDYAKYRRK